MNEEQIETKEQISSVSDRVEPIVKRIGSVLMYTDKGESTGGQVAGLNGAGDKCVVFLSDDFEKATVRANDYFREIWKSKGYRIENPRIVTAAQDFLCVPLEVIDVDA